jgi:hypothetical protein
VKLSGGKWAVLGTRQRRGVKYRMELNLILAVALR